MAYNKSDGPPLITIEDSTVRGTYTGAGEGGVTLRKI